jgi:hypothetical protein
MLARRALPGFEVYPLWLACTRSMLMVLMLDASLWRRIRWRSGLPCRAHPYRTAASPAPTEPVQGRMDPRQQVGA